MICVDASALVAIHLYESEADAFSDRIFAAGKAWVAAPTALEYQMVILGRKGEGAIGETHELLAELAIAPFTAEMLALATDAFIRFGKGRHPAQLNFGDCMSYALAKSLDAPLLFKGGDFALTDVKVAAIAG